MIIKGCSDTKCIDATPSEELKEYHRNSCIQVNLSEMARSVLRTNEDRLIREMLYDTQIKIEEENENTSCT